MFEQPNRRRIYLLRHGEAAYVSDDGEMTTDARMVPLTRIGRIQARKQAAVLASVDFDRAICSGLPRTRETATIVLAQRETPELEVVPVGDCWVSRKIVITPRFAKLWTAESGEYLNIRATGDGACEVIAKIRLRVRKGVLAGIEQGHVESLEVGERVAGTVGQIL